MTEIAEELRESVRRRYAEAAVSVTAGGSSCCGDEAATTLELDESFGSALYTQLDRSDLPVAAVAASLGCGNPTAVADLHEGERVLDLGSGGGIDVLLSAKRVGAAGFAYGVDMTTEMLDSGPGERGQGGGDERGVPAGHHRGHPTARQRGGRGDLQLRHQPVHRQAGRARRDVPGPDPGRADRHQRRRRRRPPHPPTSGPSEARTSAASPAPCPDASTSTDWPWSGSSTRRSSSPTRWPTRCTARSFAPPNPPRQPVAARRRSHRPAARPRRKPTAATPPTPQLLSRPAVAAADERHHHHTRDTRHGAGPAQTFGAGPLAAGLDHRRHGPRAGCWAGSSPIWPVPSMR